MLLEPQKLPLANEFQAAISGSCYELGIGLKPLPRLGMARKLARPLKFAAARKAGEANQPEVDRLFSFRVSDGPARGSTSSSGSRP